MERSTCKLIDIVSDVYGHLLPDFFNQSFPRENLADCDQCIMLGDENNMDASEVHGSIHEYCIFHPDVKCCTYVPDFPNFLVGALLSSHRADLQDVQKRIIQIIQLGKGITPQNIKATKSSSLEYNQLIDHSSGCYSDIGCPYFDKSGKNCSIWSFRQANCSTFFCKSVEGIAGQQFWEAMNYYLSGVEKELSLYAVESIKNSTEADLWKRDKAEFYIASFRAVEKLQKGGFQKICNSNLDSLLEQVKKWYCDATSTAIPGKLVKNPSLSCKKLPNFKYLYDTGHGRCHLSPRLHSLLHYFDGTMDNEEVVDLIVTEQNIRVPSKMMLRLYKNRILVPAGEM